MKHIVRMILAICALFLPRTAFAAASAAEEEDPFLAAISSASDVHLEENETLETLRHAAEQGSLAAQNKLGCLYSFGIDAPLDRKEAVSWFLMAADRGLADAQFNLGCCYEYGRGVRRDEGKAVELYRQAAEQGYAPAQFQLAFCLFRGKGVLEDKYDAVKWYRKAAEQGHINAQVNLAYCYDKGAGIKQDRNLARKWLHKAAGQGDENGRKQLLLMADETVWLCLHHPSIKHACGVCERVIDPIFSVSDYKGDDYFLCADCLELPHCQYCRVPAEVYDEEEGLCRDCSREAINDPDVAEAVFQEVRETLQVQYRMFTKHKIVFALGTRSELELRREDDPQKMSVYESEMVDGEPRYTIRILRNLPLDIFRIAAAEALAQDWLEATVPLAMDDPDVRDGFGLYIARLLAKKERLTRTKKMVKRLMEDGRYMSAAKLLQNKTEVGEWRKSLKSKFKEEKRKMPDREQPDTVTAQKRADVLKENEERNDARAKTRREANALIYPGGHPERPPLRPPGSSFRETDLSNTQTLLLNGLRREHQTEQPTSPPKRENDLSNTQTVLRNGLRRDK